MNKKFLLGLLIWFLVCVFCGLLGFLIGQASVDDVEEPSLVDTEGSSGVAKLILAAGAACGMALHGFSLVNINRVEA